MAAANTRAARRSMVKARIRLPNTMKGERRKSRSAMFTPFCTWFTSLVMRVMRVEVPTPSSC